MHLAFGPFRLDPASQSLWRDGEMVPLTRKAFGVLQCLVERRGDLVAKDEILARVWPDTVVGEAVLKVCVREIRRALDDDPQEPRFIATAHRRGYRFVAPVAQSAPASSLAPSAWDGPRAAGTPTLVGRDAPLAELGAALERARAGRRQVVFVTGEAGIGKTTVVDAFLERAAADGASWIARGQCPPQHGAGEAYLPVLEAIDGLCRRAGARLVGELARRAPTWLLQMPALIDETERARLVAQSLGATPQRMLREMVETLGALAADVPVVLVLEDLHWSDPATLDLISALARRREPAKLLLLATYRPAEVIVQQHPLRALKLDLQLHGFGSELSLEFLDADDVRAYLAARFGAEVAAALAPLAYQRSDGNPLFLGGIADHLVASGTVVGSNGSHALARADGELTLEVPESLRQMVEKRFERLAEEERAVLEAASVAGVEFASTAVAAALGADPMRVEDVLADLGRRGELLRAVGVDDRPDGGVASRLRFVHALYGEVLYESITPTRRAQLHQRIALGEEAAFGAASAQIAALLALHYDRGRDPARAVLHLRQAAENAARRSASREAVDYLTRALELLPRLPEDGRTSLELALWERRGLLRHSMGDLDGAVAEFASLADAAHAVQSVDLEVRALVHQATIVYLRDREAAAALFRRADAASRALPDPSIALHLKSLGAYNRLRARGFRAEDRLACAEAVRALDGTPALLVKHLGRSAMFEAAAGEYDAARTLSERGLALAIDTGDLFEHLLCQHTRAWALLHLGAWGDAWRGLADETELAQRNEHAQWAALFRLQSTWLLLEAGLLERAEALCGEALETGRSARHALSHFLGLVLLAAVRLGRGESAAAQKLLREIDAGLASHELRMEPVLRPLLESVRAGTALARGELDAARTHAGELLEVASATGDPTYQALAHRLLAQASLAAGRPADASRAIDAALALVDGGRAPLAGWRVHATAAEIATARRRRTDARAHHAASAAILARLADSLGSEPELRAAMLALSR